MSAASPCSPPARQARIGALGVAVPPFSIGQAEADELLTARYAGQLSPRAKDTPAFNSPAPAPIALAQPATPC